MQYRSKVEVLGLPLVHVATATIEGSRVRRGVARGIIAIGDIAFGIVFSAGGIAIGGVALGGIGIGVVTLAGLALGGYALGGLAIGWIALGGGAIASKAALGGAALAREFAVGGFALAEHANDPAAEAYMRQSAVRYGELLLDYAYVFIALTILPVILFRRSQADAVDSEPRV